MKLEAEDGGLTSVPKESNPRVWILTRREQKNSETNAKKGQRRIGRREGRILKEEVKKTDIMLEVVKSRRGY